MASSAKRSAFCQNLHACEANLWYTKLGAQLQLLSSSAGKPALASWQTVQSVAHYFQCIGDTNVGSKV